MDFKQRRPSRWVMAGAAAAVAAVTLVAFNFQTILWAGAVLFAERRPAILRDAQWDNASSARRFNSEFATGTAEETLLAWLEQNRFDIDRPARRAERLVEGLPCNERVVVTWTSDAQGRLAESRVNVAEAGCV